MEVVGDEDAEPAVPAGVDKAVGGQLPELTQPLELGLTVDQAVAQELLDDLAVGAFFRAPTNRLQHPARHRSLGRQVFDSPEIGQLYKIRLYDSLSGSLYDAPVPDKGYPGYLP